MKLDDIPLLKKQLRAAEDLAEDIQAVNRAIRDSKEIVGIQVDFMDLTVSTKRPNGTTIDICKSASSAIGVEAFVQKLKELISLHLHDRKKILEAELSDMEINLLQGASDDQ